MICLIFSLGSIAGIFYLLLDFITQASSKEYPLLWVIAQGFVVCGAGVVSALFFSKVADASWFFLYRYHSTNECLSVTNPLSRKTTSISLKEIQRLANFLCMGQPQTVRRRKVTY